MDFLRPICRPCYKNIIHHVVYVYPPNHFLLSPLWILWHNAPINVNPVRGECGQGVGIWQISKFFDQIPQRGKRKVDQKCQKSPHPRGKNLNKQYYNIIYNKLKEYFKSTFLLLLFMVNVSSVKLLSVIKYFLSPLASPILKNKITLGRLTVLL